MLHFKLEWCPVTRECHFLGTKGLASRSTTMARFHCQSLSKQGDWRRPSVGGAEPPLRKCLRHRSFRVRHGGVCPSPRDSLSLLMAPSPFAPPSYLLRLCASAIKQTRLEHDTDTGRRASETRRRNDTSYPHGAKGMLPP